MQRAAWMCRPPWASPRGPQRPLLKHVKEWVGSLNNELLPSVEGWRPHHGAAALCFGSEQSHPNGCSLLLPGAESCEPGRDAVCSVRPRKPCPSGGTDPPSILETLFGFYTRNQAQRNQIFPRKPVAARQARDNVHLEPSLAQLPTSLNHGIATMSPWKTRRTTQNTGICGSSFYHLHKQLRASRSLRV